MTNNKPITRESEAKKGFRCPKCHCRDWRWSVENSVWHFEMKRRRRICRNCGAELITYERTA